MRCKSSGRLCCCWLKREPSRSFSSSTCSECTCKCVSVRIRLEGRFKNGTYNGLLALLVSSLPHSLSPHLIKLSVGNGRRVWWLVVPSTPASAGAIAADAAGHRAAAVVAGRVALSRCRPREFGGQVLLSLLPDVGSSHAAVSVGLGRGRRGESWGYAGADSTEARVNPGPCTLALWCARGDEVRKIVKDSTGQCTDPSTRRKGARWMGGEGASSETGRRCFLQCRW